MRPNNSKYSSFRTTRYPDKNDGCQPSAKQTHGRSYFTHNFHLGKSVGYWVLCSLWCRRCGILSTHSLWGRSIKCDKVFASTFLEPLSYQQDCFSNDLLKSDFLPTEKDWNILDMATACKRERLVVVSWRGKRVLLRCTFILYSDAYYTAFEC